MAAFQSFCSAAEGEGEAVDDEPTLHPPEAAAQAATAAEGNTPPKRARGPVPIDPALNSTQAQEPPCTDCGTWWKRTPLCRRCTVVMPQPVVWSVKGVGDE
jgi:hypothetical protein